MSDLQDMFSDENTRKFQGHSAETRAKMSASRLKIMSPEIRANIGAHRKGQVASEATRARLSTAKLGTQHTEETRAKMSVTRKGRAHSTEWSANIKAGKIAKQSITLIAVAGVYSGTGSTGTITIEPGVYSGTKRMIASQLNIALPTLDRRIARGWYIIKEA